MDPLESFAFLSENLPSWIVNVDKLNDYTAQLQKDFAAEFSKLSKNKPAPPPRSKRSSIQSIRDDGEDSGLANDGEEDTRINGLPKAATDLNDAQYTPLDLANKYIFATARRKRLGPTASARSGASGPQRFRNKHMVVVWYDSSVQEGFEGLVRNIASARNNLRKGKMSSAMKTGFQLPSLRSLPGSTAANSSPTVNIKTGLDSQVSPAMGFKSTRANSSPVSSLSAKQGSSVAFDKADKELETAQSLCEVASHQFLRDGDCQLELENIKTHFETALQISNAERDRLEEEKKSTPAPEEEGEETDNLLLSAETPALNGLLISFSKTTLATASPALPNTAKVAGPTLATPLPPPAPNSNTIEVDDNEDGDSIDIDISAFRSARMGVRGVTRA